ncbi:hypothetical protein Clacol_000320 [Clathrus columnatus]|uniref:Vitellogenin n=1 Tax=Clathrus columnatus TaxID=1419009 RepID=A0AAV4ZZD9_9AGAM|nr:hypothetical protein Clacol_000320 [Clathrus columnatus]
MVMEAQYIGDDRFKITYGIKTSLDNDPYVELAEKALGTIAQVTAPGAHLVDIIPIRTSWDLRISFLVDLPLVKYIPSWVPGAGFQRKAKTLREEINAMTTIPFSIVKAAIKAGNAPPSIVETALGNPPGFDKDEITKVLRSKRVHTSQVSQVSLRIAPLMCYNPIKFDTWRHELVLTTCQEE